MRMCGQRSTGSAAIRFKIDCSQDTQRRTGLNCTQAALFSQYIIGQRLARFSMY